MIRVLNQKKYGNLCPKTKNDFLNAEPFPYVILDDFLDNDVAEQLLEEHKNQGSAQNWGAYNHINERKSGITKYDEMGEGAGKYARRLGRAGRVGRLLGAGLGGLRSLYDATSSGQPGALTAAAGGGFSGYYGTQGLEQFAADAGARFGQYRDAKNAPPAQ